MMTVADMAFALEIARQQVVSSRRVMNAACATEAKAAEQLVQECRRLGQNTIVARGGECAEYALLVRIRDDEERNVTVHLEKVPVV